MSKFDAQFAGRLDGQTVLVTGTKGGIGHETARGIGKLWGHGAGTAPSCRRSSTRCRPAGHQRQRQKPVPGRSRRPRISGRCPGTRRHCARGRTEGTQRTGQQRGRRFSSKALSPDGYERTIVINHVALAAVTDGLLDLLRKGLMMSPALAGGQHDRPGRVAGQADHRLELPG